MFRQVRFLTLAICLALFLSCYPASAGTLVIIGTFNGQSTVINLSDYEKNKGSFDWGTFACVPTKNERGLTEHTDDVPSAVGNWRKIGDEIQLAKVGSLKQSSGSSADLIEWKGSDLAVEKARRKFEHGDFSGSSSAKPDVSIGFLVNCDDDTGEPGMIVVLVKPGAEAAVRKYILEQGWKIAGSSNDAIQSFGEGQNALVLTTPIGTEKQAIEKLKQSGLVFDGARQLIPETTPGLGWVLVAPEHLSGTSVSALKSDLDSLLGQTWPGQDSRVHLVPRQQNTFELTFLGPLSLFTDTPKLPGFWIDTKLELVVDPLDKGNRLLISVRGARLIRWPENGKGDPPSGYGTKLDCDSGGDSNNMKSVIEIANKLLGKASTLYQGRDLTAPEC